MASFTLGTGVFPTGTTVTVYAEANWPVHQRPPVGDPLGSSTTSDTMGASSVTFTGLAENTRYYAHGEVGGVDRYVQFTAENEPPPVLTQTYSTADATHANLTAAAVATTGATAVTPFGYTTAAQANAIVTAINALRADVIDLKQFVNSVADVLQAEGLAG